MWPEGSRMAVVGDGIGVAALSISEGVYEGRKYLISFESNIAEENLYHLWRNNGS